MDEKFTFSDKQLSRLRIEYSQLDDNEFDTFVEQAERLELDPFSRQIYAVKKEGSRMQVLCTIDGLRIVAERSSKYAGQTPAMWCGNDGVWKDVWLEKTPPAACKVGVMRSDFAQSLFAVARYDSIIRGQLTGQACRTSGSLNARKPWLFAVLSPHVSPAVIPMQRSIRINRSGRKQFRSLLMKRLFWRNMLRIRKR